jgi:hypothetical protein
MPIRINLLAEQQAAEDLRRRDPVKRAMWLAGLIAGVMVVWSGRLQIKLMAAQHELGTVESEWKKLEPAFKTVTANFEAVSEAERKWAALQSLATNRFLWGNALNALQYVLTGVDDVQILRLRTDQTYFVTEATKPSTNDAGVISRGRPGSSRGKVVLTIEAKDTSKRPGDQIFKLQEAFKQYPYFKTNLQKTELITRSPEMTDPANPTRRFVTFTIECPYMEKTR